MNPEEIAEEIAQMVASHAETIWYVLLYDDPKTKDPKAVRDQYIKVMSQKIREILEKGDWL